MSAVSNNTHLSHICTAQAQLKNPRSFSGTGREERPKSATARMAEGGKLFSRGCCVLTLFCWLQWQTHFPLLSVSSDEAVYPGSAMQRPFIPGPGPEEQTDPKACVLLLHSSLPGNRQVTSIERLSDQI